MIYFIAYVTTGLIFISGFYEALKDEFKKGNVIIPIYDYNKLRLQYYQKEKYF